MKNASTLILVAAPLAALLSVGCGTANDAATEGDSEEALDMAKKKDAGPAPTWTQVYGQYFGPGSVGNCASSSCHQTNVAGFQCGTTKDTCYQGLVGAGLLNTASPAKSPLISATGSPLLWFNAHTGNMPLGGAPNAAAKAAVSAWVKAGAQDN
jgi:hypothetical protein